MCQSCPILKSQMTQMTADENLGSNNIYMPGEGNIEVSCPIICSTLQKN